MRIVEVKIGKSGKPKTSHYYLDINHAKKEADIDALNGIVSDFIEFDGDFEAERPDLGPEEVCETSGKRVKRY